MIRNFFRSAAFLSLIIAVCPHISTLSDASAQAPITYDDPTLDYKLELPFGWSTIPKIVIDQFQARVASMTGAQPQVYVAGFQKTSDKFFAYPYLLIQHRLVGGIDLDELNAESQQADLQNADKSFKNAGLLNSLDVGKTVIDRDHDAMISKVKMDVPGIGPVIGLVALMPGKVGVVQLNFYTLESALEADQKNFDSILASFKYKPGLGYTPHTGAGDSKKWQIAGFIAGLALVFGLFKIFKPKKDDDSPAPLPL